MRPSRHELPAIWAATARPEPNVAASTHVETQTAGTALITAPWVREAATFLATVAGSLAVLLAGMSLFFPSWLFAA